MGAVEIQWVLCNLHNLGGFSQGNKLRPWFVRFLFLDEKKTNQKKNHGCLSPATPAHFSAKRKELASLKQLFAFNAPKYTYALRLRKEAGRIDYKPSKIVGTYHGASACTSHVNYCV